MKEWLQEHDVPLKVLSLLLSFLLWFYVIGQEDPTKSLVFRELPVELIGTDILKNENNLMLADREMPVVTVEVSGTVSRLSSVTADKITVRADVTHITESGEYDLTYDISVPNGVTVEASIPSNVTVHFDDLVEVELPVEVYIDGDLKPGMVALDPILSQSTVTVTGMAEELANASKARVRIGANMLTNTFEASYRYTVTDDNNKELEGSSITHVDRNVRVKVPIQMQKMVDLAVNMRPGKGATVADTVVEITPKQVLVQGDIAALEELESIKVGDTIDLGSFREEYNGVSSITVPEGFILVDETETAHVNVVFKGLRVHTFRSNDITLVNEPAGYTFSLREEDLTVTVRGKASVVNRLVSGDVRFEVDLANVVLSEPSGSFKINAKTILGENVQDLGVFGPYEVTIDYEKIVADENTEENA